jgi:replication factor C subunit 1
MKTLTNYCVDLRFRRPTKSQVATKLMPIVRKCGTFIQTICLMFIHYVLGFQMDQPTLEKLCESCQGDIRLILNTLQFWSNQYTKMSFQDVKNNIAGQAKDVANGPFDVIGYFFERPTSKYWINERTDHYFVDMGIVPLMVADKYAHCNQDTRSLADIENLAMAVSYRLV